MKVVTRIFAAGCLTLALGLGLSTSTYAQAVVKARPLQIFSPASGTITIQGPASAVTSYTLTLPTTGPSLGQSLQSDGSGNFSWVGPFLPLTGGTLTGALTGTTFTGTSFSGGGSGLTSLNASNLSSGIVPAGRMPNLTGDVTSNAGSTSTSLATTGVTAGAYTSANITVDAKGRITAAANGSGGGGGSQLAVFDNSGAQLGILLFYNFGGSINIQTSTGYIVNVLMEADGSGNAFPIDQINWTVLGCTGTPDLNDGGEAHAGFPIQSYYKICCYSGVTHSLYALASPDANGLSTSVVVASTPSIENPTCMAGGTQSGWLLTALTRAAAGLPATITYPLSVH